MWVAFVATVKTYFADCSRRRALQSDIGQIIQRSNEERDRAIQDLMLSLSAQIEYVSDPGISYRRILLEEATRSDDDGTNKYICA